MNNNNGTPAPAPAPEDPDTRSLANAILGMVELAPSQVRLYQLDVLVALSPRHVVGHGRQFVEDVQILFSPRGILPLQQYRMEQLRGLSTLADDVRIRTAALELARNEVGRLLPVEPPALGAAGQMRGNNEDDTCSDLTSERSRSASIGAALPGETRLGDDQPSSAASVGGSVTARIGAAGLGDIVPSSSSPTTADNQPRTGLDGTTGNPVSHMVSNEQSAPIMVTNPPTSSSAVDDGHVGSVAAAAAAHGGVGYSSTAAAIPAETGSLDSDPFAGIDSSSISGDGEADSSAKKDGNTDKRTNNKKTQEG